jgi:hypothetical protein
MTCPKRVLALLLVALSGCPTAPMVPTSYSTAEDGCGTHCGCAVPEDQCSMPCSGCCVPQPCPIPPPDPTSPQ